MPAIDRFAIVHPSARLADDVVVGPFCNVEANTEIGPGCQLTARVSVKSGTTLGKDNLVGEGVTLGGGPQHLGAGQQQGRLIIGNRNTFRENVTLHRGFAPEGNTVIGNENYLMVAAHVGHDCKVGNNVIMANNTLLGGHVTVQDRAFVSGAVAVHQFCRIGSLAMVGGMARVTRDIPPFVTIDGHTSDAVGINRVGLKRAGYTTEQLLLIKKAYRHIFRSGLPWNEMLAELELHFSDPHAAQMADFLNGGSRGFVKERRRPRSAMLKLTTGFGDNDELRKAG